MLNVLLNLIFLVGLVWGIVWIIKRAREPKPGLARGQLGKAQIFGIMDLEEMGWLATDARRGPQLCVTGLPQGKKKPNLPRFVVYPGEGHLLTIAPAGKGKSAGPVMCNLIAYPGSVVTTDVKGELATQTACWRAQGLAQNVYVVDPWGIVAEEDIPDGKRARFNPLELVPDGWTTDDTGRKTPIEGNDSYDNARLIADALVLQGSESDPHWDRSAKALLTGLILSVALDPAFTGPRTLGSLNDILNLPQADFQKLLGGISKGPIEGAASEVNRFLQKADREASSVVSTIHTNMSFLQSPKLREAFSGSDFNWASVKRNPTSVYLCIPPRYLGTHAQFLRLMFIAAIAGMEREPMPARAPDGGKWQSVLFLMDEFANLGRMDRLLDAFALMRGYGLKFWAFVQDLNQLRGLYGADRWQTFVANAGVILAFGTGDNFTADELSRLTGQKTQVVHSESDSGQGSASITGRPLLYPDDIRAIKEGSSLMIIENKVFLGNRTLWYKADPYKELAKFNIERKTGGPVNIPPLGTLPYNPT